MRRVSIVLALVAVALAAAGVARADPSPDGTGQLDYVGLPVGYGSTANFIPFSFSLATGQEFQNGELRITLPTGWSPPSDVSTDEGYTTSTCGTVSGVGQVLTITGITLVGPADCDIVYGDFPGPGATAPSAAGPSQFSTEARSTDGGNFTPIVPSPQVDILSPDGSGTMVSDTPVVPNGSLGNTIEFTYTAAFGGIFGGAVTLTVPPGWSAPDDSDPTADGFTTTDVSCGCLFVDGRTIIVDLLILNVLGEPDTFHITYGDKSGGGAGATAPTTGGKQHWPTKEVSYFCGCGGSQFRRLASAPAIKVLSPDGAGTIKASPSTVSANSHSTITFKYAAAPGGMSNGELKLEVPAGWTQPTTTAGQDGYVTASAGTVTTLGQTITVSGLTLFGSAVTVTYAGGVAPLVTGPATWTTMERSSSTGTLTPLAISPAVTVYAPDGSGTLTTPTLTVPHGSTGQRLDFMYTAAPGGIQNGVLVLTVPPGWSAPSTDSGAAGYTTSSAGNVVASGRTITVSGLTLAGGGTVTITYGAGSGATAPGVAVGPQPWTAKERSTNTGLMTPLGSSPQITIT